MSKSNNSNSLNALQLQLEEALQMLRLVAAGKRTSIEVREWLESNHSSYINSTIKTNPSYMVLREDINHTTYLGLRCHSGLRKTFVSNIVIINNICLYYIREKLR